MYGTFVAIGLPHLLLWYSIATYSGGGANIGLGILFLGMPIYIPIFMIFGGLIGKARGASNESSKPTPKDGAA